ncbi:MAG: biotin--[acetyl-CoA-carboxylase] ligase [Ginsengibacter sp.]
MPFSSNKILVLQSVGSTNNYAMAMVQKGEAIDGNAVFAIEQQEGKGRRGKTWKANAGENITLSIMVEMQWLPASQQFQLSAAVALACHDFIATHIPAEIKIKWPNDLFINDSKAGGILIENSIKGPLWQWAVIGLGININQEDFDDYPYPAASFKKITGINYDVLALASQLHTMVLKRISILKEGDFLKLLEEYNEKLYAKDRMVRLKKENIIFETTIKKVSAFGQLTTTDAIERTFNFDEVEFKGLV